MLHNDQANHFPNQMNTANTNFNFEDVDGIDFLTPTEGAHIKLSCRWHSVFNKSDPPGVQKSRY